MDSLHILAFPVPIPGHINSLLYLCTRLVSWFNLKVTFVSSSTNYHLTLRTRNSSSPPITEVSLDIANFLEPPGLTFDEQLGALWMRPELETLIDSFKLSTPVTCILTDTFNGWVQDVADKFHIPRAVHWTASARSEIMHLYVPKLIEHGIVPVSPEDVEKVVDILPGIPPIPATELPLAFRGDYPELIDLFRDAAARYPEAKFALCNSFEELEPETIAAYRKHVKSTYFPVGPCLSPAFLSESHERSARSEQDVRCLAWLDKQAPSSVVYVSFGTIAKLSAKTLLEFAAGLELSEQPFLLVKREGVVEETAEFQEFYRGFEERNREKGLVTSWAPQMLVLLHPAVGGFFTHCGWNSTLESICASVPMLAWPCGGEQNVNCHELVRRWKIALQINEAARNHVSSLVRTLLTGEEGREMKRRASELREAAKGALAHGGSTYNNLKAFVGALQ